MSSLSLWFENHLVLVDLVYGISFLGLALVIYVQAGDKTSLSFADDLWLISLFALLHSGVEFIDFGDHLHGTETASWEGLRLALLLSSGWAFFEFGRRLWLDTTGLSNSQLGVWVYWPLLGLMLATSLCADDPLRGLATGSRLAFYMPGGALAGAGLIRYWRANGKRLATPGLVKPFHGAAIGFMLYGMAAGFVVAPDTGLPMWLPSTERFFEATGIPIQLIRATCALTIACSLTQLLSVINRRNYEACQAASLQLGALNATLERRIVERTAELETLNSALRQELEQRLAAETALREQHALFDAVANTSPALIWMSGPDRGCTYFNDPWLQFTGRPLAEELGEGWTAGVHSEDRRHCLDTYGNHFDRRLPFRMEYRLRRHDGKYRWILDEGQPRYDASGKFAGYIGSCLDITERKRVEQALRESQAQLRAIFDAEPHCVKLLDRELRALEMNRAGLVLIDADSREQIIGKKVVQMILPEHRDAFDRLCAQVLAGEAGSLQFEMQSLKGAHRWMETHAVPLADAQGKITRILAVTRDITQRKQTENALRTAEEKFRTLVEQIPAVTYVAALDETMSTLYVSPQLESLLGFGSEEWLAEPELWVRQLHDQDRERVLREMVEVHQRLQPVSTEYRILTKHGDERWFRDDAHVIRDSAGRPLFLQGVMFDITDSRQAASALQSSHELLQHLIDALPAYVSLVDHEERYQLVNLRYEGWFGRPRNEIIGKKLSEIFPPNEYETIKPHVAKAISGDFVRYELPLFDAQAQERWLDVQYVPERGPAGQCNGFFALVFDITERKRTEDALRRKETDLKRAQAVAQMGSWHLDLRHHLLEWSDEAYRLFGVTTGRPLDYEVFLSFVHPEDRALVENTWKQALVGRASEIEFRVVAGDTTKWIRERAESEFDGSGDLVASVGTLQDVTERHRAEGRLKESLHELQMSERRQRMLLTLAQQEQGRMSALLSAMSIGILFEDHQQQVEYANPAFRHMWAIDERFELGGRRTQEVLAHSTHRFARPDHASKFLLPVLDTHEISERFEVELSDGRILTQVSYPVTDPDGRILGRLWIYEDITHERQTAQQLLYLAERDPLTGLYNRHSFQEQLEQMIASALRGGTRFALLYFDLDEFKYINDTFGHRAGDTVLIRTAGEIATLVRTTEMFARLGGDEFAILSSLKSEDDVVALAGRIVGSISAIPFRFRGSNLRLTTSLGIAIFPEHGDNGEELVSHADAAMYQAKSQGKNIWSIYDSSLYASELVVRRLTWSGRIARALEEDAFELHFQGIYHAQSCQLSHLEALVRMRDPAAQDRLIMPGQFMAAAEKSRQVLDIDRWVIRRSIETLSQSPNLPPLAVNVSGRTFDEPTLPHFIRNELARMGVDSRRLIVELTETAAVSDLHDAQRFIEAIRQAGCRVCLDDFGSGFSTFAYLKYLGVEFLKIDGLFIRDLPNNRDNQVFVKAMIDVARGLNKRVVAEFVEDADTLEMLRQLGVDFVQGYHLERPMAAHPALTDAGALFPPQT